LSATPFAHIAVATAPPPPVLLGPTVSRLPHIPVPRLHSVNSSTRQTKSDGMEMLAIVALLVALIGTTLAGQHMPEFSQPLFPDSQFIDLISRDIEAVSGPIAFGHKYMTGGAGEGDQQLHPDNSFEHRQEVKSDNVLPAYCEPPNPCPVGFTGSDGCLEEFENTAEFSRNYQAEQKCLCDQEHMFNCPSKNTAEQYEQDLEQVLAKNGMHKSMIAKKFHITRAEEPRRRKRSTGVQQQASHAHSRFNPYLEGEALHSVQKKDGRNLMQM